MYDLDIYEKCHTLRMHVAHAPLSDELAILQNEKCSLLNTYLAALYCTVLHCFLIHLIIFHYNVACLIDAINKYMA